MTRRKIVHPGLFTDVNQPIDITYLRDSFEDLQTGEIIVNVNEGENMSLLAVGSGDTFSRFIDEGTVMTKIEEAVANLDTFATKDELGIVSGDVETLKTSLNIVSGLSHNHSNKNVLDGITADKVEAWDLAQANSSAYTNEKIADLVDIYEKKGVAESALTEAIEYVDKKVIDLSTVISGFSGDVITEFAKYYTSAQTDYVVVAAKADVYASAITYVNDNFATQEELSRLAESAGKIDVVKLDGKEIEIVEKTVDIELSGTYATKLYVAKAIAEAEFPNETGGSVLDIYLTEEDISNRPTAEEISGYVKTYVEDAIENLDINGDDIDLDGYATSADVMTTDTIAAVGGVWAEDIKKVFGDNIPTGLTFVDFLKKMVFIEKFATNVDCETILDVTCAAPGAGINLTNNQNYEVGTIFKLNKVEAKDTSVTHKIKTTGLEYGYKIGENGGYTTATTYTQNLEPVLISEDTMLKATFTGFTDFDGESISTVSGTSELSAMEFYVGNGTNKVIISQSGETYSSNTTASTNSVYVATNMGNYYKENSADLNIFIPEVESKTAMANASSTYTVNGYRNTYYGTTPGGEDLNDISFIKSDALKKSGKTIKSGDTITFKTNKDDKHFRMIIVSPREISSVTDDMVQQILTGDLINSMKKLSIPGANGYQPIEYYVYDYTWVAAFDNKNWIITFK